MRRERRSVVAIEIPVRAGDVSKGARAYFNFTRARSSREPLARPSFSCARFTSSIADRRSESAEWSNSICAEHR